MEKQKNRAFAATNWAVGEMDQLFVAVARYTRFVLFSKWFFGLFALALLGGLIAWPLLGKDQTGLRLSFTSADGAQKIASPVMESPRYMGDDDKGQRYEISGKRAIQRTAVLVQIEQPEGQLIKANGSIVGMRADSAMFHQDTKMVELTGNVNLFDDSGTIFATDSATINTVTMDIDGAQRIEGSGPNGNVVATGFKIRDKGRVVTFGLTPGVRLHIDKMRRGS
ncbi:MAG: LPS export ABC transporter periplasmic protein LptC [Rhodospirillales bacterium 12-54-5]|nr:MAG: LPS export ABC transporter periplasmic protein LptC [Rhodospirillales bacterium 12-54-5]